MSVQAGVWNFDGRPIDAELLARLTEALRHQGPDGEFLHQEDSIAFLYRPFHTTAESRRERQPFLSRRDFIITWDGRLDNRDDLIIDLRPDLEPEPTDVAIVAAAFDRWETDCFRRIVGEWAASIWKPRRRELIFAVDYMAIRHVFYRLKEHQISWSTDLSALVRSSGDTFHVDDDYVAGYFAHHPDAQLTPYREIREAPPGHFISVRNGRAIVDRYWRFSPKSRIRHRTDSEYEEHFRYLFRQSVRRRLRSDSPVLAELSGGLDSSSIVCMADNILRKDGAQTPQLDTLSFYDTTEPNGDDWIYSRKIEAHRERTGHHIDASKLGISPESPEYSEFMALPGYLGSARELEVERAAVIRGGGYRAVLSGIGGDEFLGGIPNPAAQLADLIVQFKFVTLARQLMAWSLVKRRPLIQLLGQAARELMPPSLGQYFTAQARIETWIEGGFAARTRIAMQLLDVNEHFGLWLPTRRSYIGGIFLMANALAKWSSPTLALEESRYPYLDQNLLEFGLSIPATQLLRAGERRSLMRRALVGIVPQEILSRKTKQFGARTPIIALEKHLDRILTHFEDPLSSQLGYVNPVRFQKVLQSVREGKNIHTIRALRAVSLELWLRDLASRHLLDPAMVRLPPATQVPIETSP